MASFVYNEGAKQLLNGSTVYTSDTIKVRLIASSATPNKDDTSLAVGYSAIGTDQTLGSKTQTKDTVNDRIVFDAANSTWSSVAGGSTVGFAIVYKDDGGNGVPLACIDLADTATNGGDITVDYNADGIFYTQQ